MGRWSVFGRRLLLLHATVCGAIVLLGLGAGDAWSAKGDHVTLNFLGYVTGEPAYSAHIEAFEQAHPNITIEATYAPTLAVLYQLETTELAAGHAPDLLTTSLGCGTPISVCKLARAGYVAPMLKKPWARASSALVLSYEKYGATLYAYTPTVGFDGLFTNDTLFSRLHLKVPQTFSQLLDICRRAKTVGVTPLLLTALGSNNVRQLVNAVALNTVYAKDPHWAAKLRAGTATFDGTSGWHQALAEVVEMSSSGCFQPGPAATTAPAGDALFGQGRALMYFQYIGHKGAIDAGNPQFAYSEHPFPAGSDPQTTVAELGFSPGVSVNAHTSAQNQAAAQAFVDFLARPDQAVLHARTDGGISAYQLAGGKLPVYLSSFTKLVQTHRVATDPGYGWWNADVQLALATYGTGLLTGQTTIDDVLKAMDAAWKVGPD